MEIPVIPTSQKHLEKEQSFEDSHLLISKLAVKLQKSEQCDTGIKIDI